MHRQRHQKQWNPRSDLAVVKSAKPVTPGLVIAHVDFASVSLEQPLALASSGLEFFWEAIS